MKNIAELTGSQFESEVLQASGPVVVDFYAPWCGPCKMLTPLLDQFASEFAGRLKLVKVNVDDAPAVADTYQVTGVPTLAVFRDGKLIDTLVGLVPPRSLKTWLESKASAPAASAA